MCQWKMEALSPSIRVCVSKDHRFGTDAFLLADFARHGSKDRVLDLCAGCGILPLLLCKRRPPKEIHALELQPEAAKLMEQGIAASGLSHRIFPHLGDLRLLTRPGSSPFPGLEPGSFDLVTCNPPYFDSKGILSVQESQRTARHETQCSIRQVCAAASRQLRYGGRFCLCYRPQRLSQLFSALSENGLEPKRLRMVQKDPASAPWLVLCEGKKGAKPFLQVLAPLFIRGQEQGGFSKELIDIYDWQQPGD